MPAALRRLALLILPLVPGFGQAQPVTYAEIAPILQARCVLCHSSASAPLGLCAWTASPACAPAASAVRWRSPASRRTANCCSA